MILWSGPRAYRYKTAAWSIDPRDRWPVSPLNSSSGCGGGEMIYKNPSPTNKTDVIYRARARVRRPINRSAEPLVVVHDRDTHNNIMYLRHGPPPSTDRLSSIRVRTSATMSAESRAHKFTRATHHGFAPITQILYHNIILYCNMHMNNNIRIK